LSVYLGTIIWIGKVDFAVRFSHFSYHALCFSASTVLIAL